MISREHRESKAGRAVPRSQAKAAGRATVRKGALVISRWRRLSALRGPVHFPRNVHDLQSPRAVSVREWLEQDAAAFAPRRDELGHC